MTLAMGEHFVTEDAKSFNLILLTLLAILKLSKVMLI